MSCLTRKLQHRLSNHLVKQFDSDTLLKTPPYLLREKLISEGICPSDVTLEQVKMIIENR